jgi:hypothetical protein
MTTTEHGCHHQPWEHFGRAAERFARRVADDARFFADRIEEHAGELAHAIRREWNEPGPGGLAPSDEMRRLLDDVNGIVRDVADGVDELLEGLFREDGRDARRVSGPQSLVGGHDGVHTDARGTK